MNSFTTQIEIVEDNFLETNEHFLVMLEVVSSEVPLSLSRNQARVIIESNDGECTFVYWGYLLYSLNPKPLIFF